MAANAAAIMAMAELPLVMAVPVSITFACVLYLPRDVAHAHPCAPHYHDIIYFG